MLEALVPRSNHLTFHIFSLYIVCMSSALSLKETLHALLSMQMKGCMENASDGVNTVSGGVVGICSGQNSDGPANWLWGVLHA